MSRGVTIGDLYGKNDCYCGGNKSILYTLLQSFDLYLLLHKWELDANVGTHSKILLFSSVQFSHSVVSDSLRPHGLQHAGLPCPSLTPGRFYYQKFICGFQIDTFRLLILFKLVDLLIQFLTKSLDNSHFNLDFYLEKIISYKCFYIKGKFSLHKCKINNYSFSCLMYYNKLHCQGAEKSNHSVEGRHSSQASHSRQGRQSCQPRVCRSTAV